MQLAYFSSLFSLDAEKIFQKKNCILQMQLTKVLQSQGLVAPCRPRSASISSLKYPPQPCIISFFFWAKLGYIQTQNGIFWGHIRHLSAAQKLSLRNFVSEKSTKKFQMITQKMHLLFNHKSGVQVSSNLKTKNLKLKKTFDFSSFEILLHLPAILLHASCHMEHD